MLKLITTLLFLAASLSAQTFSCPSGTADMMKYFVMSASRRSFEHMDGANAIFSEVTPNTDFPPLGYAFWFKSASAHGFDIKSFDSQYIYDRSTELNWTDNTTFKRFNSDLPLSPRCVTSGKASAPIKVANTTFTFYSNCSAYKSSNIGTSVNSIDAPILKTVGNIGKVNTRLLHYRYNCDASFSNCHSEEQFFLANGYGLYRWQLLTDGVLKQTSNIDTLTLGIAPSSLPCQNSYQAPVTTIGTINVVPVTEYPITILVPPKYDLGIYMEYDRSYTYK